MAFYSPLRYPGGKGKLAPFIGDALTANGLTNKRYVEFYAGGAGIALYLLRNRLAREVLINDLDERIYSFWYAILNYSSRFLKEINACQVNMEAWHRHKEICDRPEKADRFQLGFSTFFLNRTNRSGIIEGGVIGGQNQTGQYKLDARFNRTALCHRISDVARLKNKISLSRRDACSILEEDYLNPSDHIFFFDPPYYLAKNQLYANFNKNGQHEKLAGLIKNLRAPWLATYNSCAEIEKMYSGCNRQSFRISYYAQKRRAAPELLFYGNLALPMPPYTAIKDKKPLRWNLPARA